MLQNHAIDCYWLYQSIRFWVFYLIISVAETRKLIKKWCRYRGDICAGRPVRNLQKTRSPRLRYRGTAKLSNVEQPGDTARISVCRWKHNIRDNQRAGPARSALKRPEVRGAICASERATIMDRIVDSYVTSSATCTRQRERKREREIAARYHSRIVGIVGLHPPN